MMIELIGFHRLDGVRFVVSSLPPIYWIPMPDKAIYRNLFAQQSANALEVPKIARLAFVRSYLRADNIWIYEFDVDKTSLSS